MINFHVIKSGIVLDEDNLKILERKLRSSFILVLILQLLISSNTIAVDLCIMIL